MSYYVPFTSFSLPTVHHYLHVFFHLINTNIIRVRSVLFIFIGMESKGKGNEPWIQRLLPLINLGPFHSIILNWYVPFILLTFNYQALETVEHSLLYATFITLSLRSPLHYTHHSYNLIRLYV